MSTRTIQQLLDLSGKTALVTGGSRGLGLQMAQAFAKKSMIARRSGRIINIASVAGLNGNGEGMNTIATTPPRPQPSRPTALMRVNGGPCSLRPSLSSDSPPG